MQTNSKVWVILGVVVLLLSSVLISFAQDEPTIPEAQSYRLYLPLVSTFHEANAAQTGQAVESNAGAVASPQDLGAKQKPDAQPIVVEQPPPDLPKLGIVYAGLQRSLNSNCGQLYQVKGTTLCSHGPDLPPAGFNVSNTNPEMAANNQAKTVFPAVCDGDGVSGNRVQMLYVRASDHADRFSQYLSSMRQWAADMDQIYYDSAVETGGARRVRFVHDASCVLSVLNVVLSPTGDDNFSNTTDELAALGYNRTDRKYTMFMDANVYCGIGSLRGDDQASQNNSNNFGPSYSRADNGCWNGYTIAHELMHNLGGVQLSAPHTSGGYHCVDEYDVMCYSDSPNNPTMQYLCTDSAHENRFDCNHDDYYHTDPTAGSYLATHWNSANNQFLISIQNGISLPSNLQATVASGTQVNLTWIDNATNETGFKIERCQGASCTNFTQIATVAANVTTYANTGLTAGTIYLYRVRANNATGDSAYSNTATTTTATPTAPSNLQAAAASSTQIKLTWIDNATNETGFKIERCQGASCTNFAQIATVATNVATYANTGLTAGAAYFYRVRANNAAGDSAYSNTATATTTTAIPAAPSNLQAAAASSTQINLTWIDNATNETGFKIERCQGASCTKFAQIATVAANVTTYANTGLTAGATYLYRVRANNAAGDSAYSNTATATTTAIPAATSNLQAATASSTQINLTWTDNASTEMGFKLERCQGASCTSFTDIGALDANETAVGDSDLASGVTYCYHIRTYNDTGDSAWSNTVCAATRPPTASLAAPGNLRAIATSPTQVYLTWIDNSTAEGGVKIERCQGAGCTNFVQSSVVGKNLIKYINTRLTLNTTYCYRVLAYSAASNSPYANIACAITPTTAALSSGGDPALAVGEVEEDLSSTKVEGDATSTVDAATGLLTLQAKAQASFTVQRLLTCNDGVQPNNVTLLAGEAGFAMSMIEPERQLYKAAITLPEAFAVGNRYPLAIAWTCGESTTAQNIQVGELQIMGAGDEPSTDSANLRLFLPVVIQ